MKKKTAVGKPAVTRKPPKKQFVHLKFSHQRCLAQTKPKKSLVWTLAVGGNTNQRTGVQQTAGPTPLQRGGLKSLSNQFLFYTQQDFIAKGQNHKFC